MLSTWPGTRATEEPEATPTGASFPGTTPRGYLSPLPSRPELYRPPPRSEALGDGWFPYAQEKGCCVLLICAELLFDDEGLPALSALMDPFCFRDTGSCLEPAWAGQAASRRAQIRLHSVGQRAVAAPAPRPWIHRARRRLGGSMWPDSGPLRPSHLPGAIGVSFPTAHTHTHTSQTLKAAPPAPATPTSQACGCQKPEKQKGRREGREGMLRAVR